MDRTYPVYTRLIERLETPATPGLIAYSQLVKNLNPVTEKLVRTYHPVFSNHEVVCIYQYPNTSKIWLIPSSNQFPLTTRLPELVVGRIVRMLPEIDPPVGDMRLPDPFPNVNIKPYTHPGSELHDKVMELFPNSVGLGLLYFGITSIFFRTKKEVLDVLAGPRPETIGGLLCFFGDAESIYVK